MADVTKTTYELKLLAAFADEDDRTITITDPRSDVTATDIHNFAEKAAPVLIGDKYGATFTRFKEARYVEKSVTTLDMTL